MWIRQHNLNDTPINKQWLKPSLSLNFFIATISPVTWTSKQQTDDADAQKVGFLSKLTACKNNLLHSLFQTQGKLHL